MLTFEPVLNWRSGDFGEPSGEGGEPFGRRRQLEDPLRRILIIMRALISAVGRSFMLLDVSSPSFDRLL